MWDALQEAPKSHIKNPRAMPVHFSYTASFLVKQPILFAARLQKASDNFVANFIWMVKILIDFATGLFFLVGANRSDSLCTFTFVYIFAGMRKSAFCCGN